jgi:branched-chain amino acid transport system permease protein
MQIEIVTPMLEEIKKSFLASLWFMFLTFPIMVIRVNTVENIIEWRWPTCSSWGSAAFCSPLSGAT